MRIVLIDDDPLVTGGIKTIIERSTQEEEDPILVVGVGSDGQEALALYREEAPDLVLMDIRMPGVDGIQAGKEILQEDPQAKIIYLTTFLEDDYIIQALKIGAKGYLLKTDYASLVPAIRAAMEGQRVYGDEVVKVLPAYLEGERKRRTLPGLTEKEMDIVRLVAEGLNNQEIADRLHFSTGTIRNYLSVILEKVQVRDRTQLAVYYYKNT